MVDFKLIRVNIHAIKLLLSLVAIVFLLDCAKIAPPVPLGGRQGIPGAETVPPFLARGSIIDNRDSVGVQKYDESSWIGLQFKGEIDTTSKGIKIFDSKGNKVNYAGEWKIADDRTGLILKPAERLDYNNIYFLKISGTEIRKLNGNYVDLNGDGKSGEALADGLVFPFVTFKADNSPGDWLSIKKDDLPPFIIPSIDFLIENKISDYVWTDANIALNIYDYTWQNADTSIIVVAVDSASIGKDDFKVIDQNSGEEISVKRVSYISDDKNPIFGRIILEMEENFEPQSWYALNVFGDISDYNGNKLGERDSIVFEKAFKTFNCNSDSSECLKDTVSPEIINWENLGVSFEVSFSEIIDPESINENSIYIPDIEGELFLRNEYGYTTVRFVSSKRITLSGSNVFVTVEVRDLAGNKMKEVSHYFE
jgi:hypothetical protein